MQQYWKEHERTFLIQAGEITAACMKEQGFEYIPTDPEMALSWEPDEIGDPVAWAKENGYGVVPDEDDEGEPWPDDEFSDPNAAYVESLSEDELMAYWAALYGAWDDEDDMPAPDSAGCMDKGYEAVYNPLQENPSLELMEFSDFFDDKVENDKRVRDAVKTWVSCMEGKGYAVSEGDDLSQDFWDRHAALMRYDDETFEGFDEATYPRAELAELRAEEIATATADAQCKVKAKTDKARADAEFDAETEYYAAHKDAVDAWFAELEAWAATMTAKP